MNRLNYFYPFDRKGAHFEDNATRALLALLRFVPFAQEVFVNLVRSAQRAAGEPEDRLLPALTEIGAGVTDLATQTGTLEVSDDTVVVSLVITDQQKSFSGTVGLRPQGQDAIYDGVIYYAPNHVIVVEDKPNNKDVDEAQLDIARSSVPEGVTPCMARRKLCLTWPDLVARLVAARESDRSGGSFGNRGDVGKRGCIGAQISGAEALLVNDFEDYLSEQFPNLSPYQRFSMCRDDLYRLERRCRDIMRSVAPSRLSPHRNWGWYLRAGEGPVLGPALSVREVDHKWEIVLQLYPGDTVNQARALYDEGNLNRNEALALREDGWSVSTNLHFQYIQSHLFWAEGEASLEFYVDYWLARVRDPQVGRWRAIRRWEANEWPEMERELQALRFISVADLNRLEQERVARGAIHLNVCPGLGFEFKWSREEALRLDDQKAFEAQFKRRVEQAMRTWNQPSPWEI
jgi:hypothetical protein